MPRLLRLLAILSVTLWPSALAARQSAEVLGREIRESQQRMEDIRAERTRLQAEMEVIRGQVRDVSSELGNVERQLSATRSVLAEVEFQVEALGQQTRLTTAELLRTRDTLRERQAILHRRLRAIYERGPLSTYQVLLGADSFTELITRVRYLQIVADHDRRLVATIGELEASLETKSAELQSGLAELGRLRELQLAEVAELRQVEESRQQTLQQFRARERQASSRIDQLEADLRRLTGLLADLERRRVEEERRRAAAAAVTGAPPPPPPAVTLTAADMGRLDWPVNGDIIYRFGPDRRPNGTILRWNGVGIRAAPGTPVQAVRQGVVALAGPFEGYGPTVILSHGDGFYTLYLYLQEIRVVEGRVVPAGAILGTVGGVETPEGPHLEFQVRVPAGDGVPQAQDPLRWLSPRGR
jgi:septal ring factor EnvC (AmiA/AmiB activator)